MSENVGKISRDLILKGDKNDHTVVEQMQEQLSDYEKNFWEAFDRGKTKSNGLFFIEVITKKEKLMENVLRNYFIDKSACPTPTYDQVVYKCDGINNKFELLWAIPDKEVCYYLKHNALIVAPEERELLHYVLEFFDDTLMIKAKKLNGEFILTPFLDKGMIC